MAGDRDEEIEAKWKEAEAGLDVVASLAHPDSRDAVKLLARTIVSIVSNQDRVKAMMLVGVTADGGAITAGCFKKEDRLAVAGALLAAQSHTIGGLKLKE